MRNLHRATAFEATALELPFGGLTTTRNPQYQRRKKDLFGNLHPNYFAMLIPEVDPFLKACNIANNWHHNIVIIVITIIIMIIIIIIIIIIIVIINNYYTIASNIICDQCQCQ